MEPLRVLTADDDPIFRDRLRSYSHPLRTPTWSARRRLGPEAVERALELQPDVGVLVLTMFDDDSGWLASLR
jgi:CheY-like chemotaxis protein